jgi:hypothetical protein
MARTRIDYELPFSGVNAEGLRAGVARQLTEVDASDIDIVYGHGHPDAISDSHVIGLVFKVDPETVTQISIDAVTSEVQSLLGCQSTSAAGGVTTPTTSINRRDRYTAQFTIESMKKSISR